MTKKPTSPARPHSARKSVAKIALKASASTKQEQVLALLRRQSGASIDEIVAATDWQKHSVRGFMSGAVKKRLDIEVISEKGADGVRRYFVAPLKS